MSHIPRITVLMSAYNSERYIAEAVSSILNQEFDDFRFVIYDNASMDRTLSILRSFDDPRIELRINSINKGLATNLADGVRRADTEFIARMDADDIAYRGRFARQVGFLDAHPEVGVLGTSVNFFDEKRECLGRQPVEHEQIALSLLFEFGIMHPTVIMRTRVLRDGGWNYDPNFDGAEDFDLWVRMIHKCRFHNLPEPCLALRVHEAKMTVAGRDKGLIKDHSIRERQLAALGVMPSSAEASAFLAAVRGDVIDSRSGFSDLERALAEIVDANRKASLYSQRELELYAARFFVGACRRALLGGCASGMAFWTSPLSRAARVSPIRLLGMGYRSIRALTHK